MPRPKGSKNKSTATIAERKEAVKKEIAALEVSLKEKKAELKKLEEEEAEEQKERLYQAVKASGKTIDEVLEMLAKA